MYSLSICLQICVKFLQQFKIERSVPDYVVDSVDMLALLSF